MSTQVESFNVGGVILPRPFRIRRLSHFGLNVEDVPHCLPFYAELLGFTVADEIELSGRFKTAAEAAKFPFTRGIFMRHGTDHHSLVLFPRRVLNALAGYPPLIPAFHLNQIAWQVGSIREVSDAIPWFRRANVDLLRIGRDQPGGNWHVYSYDPDRCVNEMFYGLEQIGWDWRSKPLAVYGRLLDAPTLPIKSEFRELLEALDAGVSIDSGYRQKASTEGEFDVDGVMLPRPFKVVATGPIRVFVSDLEESLNYYRNMLGLMLTEEVQFEGHRCVFLRANTEHHSLALYPEALRKRLGVAHESPLLSAGVQVANYRQLKAAVAYLAERGVTVTRLPAELSPGIDYSALALDPEGNAVQLYYYMEQVGWDGKPRPAAERLPAREPWPETVTAHSDTYLGTTFFGPWG